MPLGAVLAGIGSALAPIGGAIGSAALQRSWALKDWNRVNAYNHPKEQIKRNTEAGLPLAAMFSGYGGSTSSAPNTTQVDPTLGTAKGLEGYFTNRMQRKQLQLMDEELRAKAAEADIKEGERDWLIKQGIHEPIAPEDPESEGGVFHSVFRSNQMQSLNYDKRQKAAQAQTAEIVADLQRAKTQTEIDHVLQTIEIGKENVRGQRIINKINEILTSNIGDGKWDIIQSMIYKLILR